MRDRFYDLLEKISFWAYVYASHKPLAPRSGEVRIFESRLTGVPTSVTSQAACDLSRRHIDMAEQRLRWARK